MYSPTVYLSLVVLLQIPNVASAADVNAKVGERILIQCKITGTYVLPEWLKDTTISIANQGGSSINPSYSGRFSYDSDQRTLIVDPVQLNDTGSYVCTHSGGTNSPQTTTVEITANIGILVKCFGVSVAVCVFFALTRVNDTVVIIKCIKILIDDHNNNKKEKKEDRKHNILIVLLILITAIVMFLAVSGWFIGMQATVDAFQEMTQYNCNVYIGLLSFEVFDFVLDVCFIIYLFCC